ncbi:MAG: ABC transporter substrate-binding protein [Bacteroidales bacterium]
MKNRKKRAWFYACIALLSIVLTGMYSCSNNDEPTLTEETVHFGALLNLSYDITTSGITNKAAIDFALSDLNTYAATAGRKVTFKCLYADTRMDTLEAKTQMEDMYAQGVRMFVAGPNSSSELIAIAPFVEKHPIALINSNSTSIGLNHAGSHIYRIITDDRFQAKGLIRTAFTQGVRVIIPIVRNDVWGNSLLNAFKGGFVAEGGLVYPGVEYDPSATSFVSLAAAVNEQVGEAIATHGASNVAVLALTYNEITGIMTAASSTDDLGSVQWFGCDGNAQLEGLVTDNTVAEFAIQTDFLAPLMGIGWTLYTPPFTELLSSRIAEKTGIIPDVYALSAYDATFIMGLAYLQVGKADMDKINDMIPLVCSTYDRMGISRQLNANGDLLQANYIFWRVARENAGFRWSEFATYWYDIDVFE